MNIAFFASSLVSAYWNGAATYYRGVVRALHDRGHRVRFYEPDAFERQQHRDMPNPEWAEVIVYSAERGDVLRCVDEARHADLVVKASGVGVFDELLESAVLDAKRAGSIVAFWDVDAPATLDRLSNDPSDPFATLVPRYDLILTYGGGHRVVSAYSRFGARQCVPIYNGLDTSTHFPAAVNARFEGDLGFLGNRLPDREKRVEEFFFRPAERLSDSTFVLGGSGWQEKHDMPDNVNYVGHVYTADHNAFNATPRAVLNVHRQSMARYGFSPATRVFEAAGAGACIITDAFDGVETFFEPDKEILVAENGDEVAEHLKSLSAGRARSIGAAALKRVLAEHTYGQRVALLEEVLDLTTAEAGA